MLDEQIERSFGVGPEHRPIEERIAAGRRALRRRRAAAAVASVGVVAVIGTAVAVALPGADDSSTGRMATTPSATTSASAEDPGETAEPTPSATPWQRNQLARYADDGTLEIRPGVQVNERIANPFGYDRPSRSVGLDVTWQGDRVWTIVEITPRGASYGTSVPSNGWASFADWVADQSGSTVVNGGWPDTVVLDPDGQVVAASGAEIRQRTDDPQLGDDFAPPGTPTGAALVVVESSPPDYFVVWRVVDGELDVIVVPPQDVVGATFQELLAYARSQYASGEGLR